MSVGSSICLPRVGCSKRRTRPLVNFSRRHTVNLFLSTNAAGSREIWSHGHPTVLTFVYVDVGGHWVVVWFLKSDLCALIIHRVECYEFDLVIHAWVYLIGDRISDSRVQHLRLHPMYKKGVCNQANWWLKVDSAWKQASVSSMCRKAIDYDNGTADLLNSENAMGPDEIFQKCQWNPYSKRSILKRKICLSNEMRWSCTFGQLTQFIIYRWPRYNIVFTGS